MYCIFCCHALIYTIFRPSLDDVLHFVFTVYETLWYHANLRLGGEKTYQERLQRIEYVLTNLGLENCKDVLVGDSRNKGISGGQRKRLCIAIELLSSPAVLFLDEPTSGIISIIIALL